MTQDGQKALIAGGLTTLDTEHFNLDRDPRDPAMIPLPDLLSST